MAKNLRLRTFRVVVGITAAGGGLNVLLAVRVVSANCYRCHHEVMCRWCNTVTFFLGNGLLSTTTSRPAQAQKLTVVGVVKIHTTTTQKKTKQKKQRMQRSCERPIDGTATRHRGAHDKGAALTLSLIVHWAAM